MQALLSYDQSPPIGAPFRFFLAAPLFGVLAGLLLMWSGPSAFLSRWTPEALAVTHLVTAGFMLQVMLGALVQVFPVVAGANIRRPLLISGLVHAAISVGGLLLALAFLRFSPPLFLAAGVCFCAGLLLFVSAAAWAMRGVPSSGPTIGGLKIAVLGLAVTVALGAAMLLGLTGYWDGLPVMDLADVHLGWGLAVWGGGLVAAVAYVVVPMFQITPAYPVVLSRVLVPGLLLGAALWSWARLAPSTQPGLLPIVLGALLALAGGCFAVATLVLQRRSRRPRFDASQIGWLIGMVSVLVAVALWLAANGIPAVGEWTGWPMLCGVLVMYGGFVSVINGMLYKIVPFLTWLHLQNLGQGVLLAPNMKKIVDEHAMMRQMTTHGLVLALLVLSVFWPTLFAVPAGGVMACAHAWLVRNLWAAVGVFRTHRRRIAEKRAES